MPLASFRNNDDTINIDECINSITRINHKDEMVNDDTTFSMCSGDSVEQIVTNPKTSVKQYEMSRNNLYCNVIETSDQQTSMSHQSTPDSVIDELYAAEPYLLNAIKTERFCCIMSNPDSCKHNHFVKLMKAINQKPSIPSFQVRFCQLIPAKSFEEIQDLLTLNLSSNIFNVFQMKCIFRIHFSQYPQILYSNAKQYCINISKNKNNWWSLMRQHFVELIDFTQIDMYMLVHDIKNDKIFSDTEMLNIIQQKVTNNHQTFRMSNCILTIKQINNLKPGDKIDYFDQFWDSGTIISINVERNCAIVTSEEYYAGTQHEIRIGCNEIAMYRSIQHKGKHCLEQFRNIKLHDHVLVNYKFVCDGAKYPDKWIIATVKRMYSIFSDSYWITVDPVYQNNSQTFAENYKFYLNSVDEIQPICFQ